MRAGVVYALPIVSPAVNCIPQSPIPPAPAQDKATQQCQKAAAPRPPSLEAAGERGGKSARPGKPRGGAPLHNLSDLCLELARRDQEKGDEAVRAGPSSVGAKRSGDRSTKQHNKKRKAA